MNEISKGRQHPSKGENITEVQHGLPEFKTSGHPGQVETILVTTGDRSETIKAVKVGSNIKEEIGEFTKQISNIDYMHSLPDDEFE